MIRNNPFIVSSSGSARTLAASLFCSLVAASSVVAGIMSDGVNLQPSYYNNGNVTIGWSLMNQNSKIGSVRIEIEPDKVTQAKTWIAEAKSNGKTIMATYHKSATLGSDSTSELTAAANWWRTNYSQLNASGAFTLNISNEWGSHDITSNNFASAYNSAISTVRQVYSGRLIIDIPGWGQETRTAADAVKGTNGTKINDTNIALSTHIYPGAWNQGRSRSLANADLDEMATANVPCLVGEFGNSGGSGADWSALTDHARGKGWTLLAWCWNGDGGSMNMVSPSWASNATATSFSKSSYFDIVYNKLAGGGGGGGGTVPASPTNLSASATSSSQINLTWTDAANNETNYKVERATSSGGPWTELTATLAAGTTSYSATGLTASTTYYFRVRASNSTGNSGYSSTASATTQASGGGGGDTADYSFESGTQSWAAISSNVTGVGTSTAQKFAGSSSLRVTINKTTSAAAGCQVGITNAPTAVAGKTVTFRFWVPSNCPLQAIQPFVQTGSGWTWTSNWVTSFTKGAWNTVTLNVPNTTPVQRLGVEFYLNNTFSGDCYVDSVDY